MQKVTSKDGTIIAYEQTGKGPVLILVSGASMDHLSHEPLAEELAAYFTVINYDRRGHGESTNTQPYAVERELEDIDALISATGGSACIYGISSGAALAFEAAASRPAIKKAALYEPPYSVDHTGDRNPTSDDVKQLKELLSADRRGDAVELFFTKLVGIPAGAVAGMKSSPMWSGLEAIAPTFLHDAMISATNAGDFSLPKEQMSSIKIPMLVLDGGASWDWIRATAKAVAEGIPQSEHRTLEGQTHGVDPKVLTPVLKDFLISKD